MKITKKDVKKIIEEEVVKDLLEGFDLDEGVTDFFTNMFGASSKAKEAFGEARAALTEMHQAVAQFAEVMQAHARQYLQKYGSSYHAINAAKELDRMPGGADWINNVDAMFGKLHTLIEKSILEFGRAADSNTKTAKALAEKLPMGGRRAGNRALFHIANAERPYEAAKQIVREIQDRIKRFKGFVSGSWSWRQAAFSGLFQKRNSTESMQVQLRFGRDSNWAYHEFFGLNANGQMDAGPESSSGKYWAVVHTLLGKDYNQSFAGRIPASDSSEDWSRSADTRLGD